MVVLDATIVTNEEYLEAADLLTAQRNARADRSGFTPDQRSLGKNVRLPGHMLSHDRIDADLLGAQASDAIRRTWDIQDAASRACVSRRNADACKAALAARRRNWQSEEVPEGAWVMVWRKYDGEGGWYGPGLHLARSRNNRSHWVNMGARLWKCSREQLRLATDEEGLSKEVALALSCIYCSSYEFLHIRFFLIVSSELLLFVLHALQTLLRVWTVWWRTR